MSLEHKIQARSRRSVYCVCKVPYEGEFMIQCDECEMWFHPHCVDMDDKTVELLQHIKGARLDCVMHAQIETATPRRVPLYCVCRQPHIAGDVMIQCEDCEDWFHPHCLGLSRHEECDYLNAPDKQFQCVDHEAEQSRRSLYMKTELYMSGYTIVRRGVAFSGALIQRIGKKMGRVSHIFNDNADCSRNDMLRLQAGISINVQADMPGFVACMDAVLGKGSSVSMSWVVLHSKKGCQRQGAHCDYHVGGHNWSTNSQHVSHGCLVALEDNTKFDVWVGAHHLIDGGRESSYLPKFPVPRSVEYLNKGDVLFFRGDCFHAGSEYLKMPNTRLHCYLDIKPMPHTINKVARSRMYFSGQTLENA